MRGYDDGDTKSQWLVSGHGILDNHVSRGRCVTRRRRCWGPAPAIVENGVAVAIKPWSDFDRQPQSGTRVDYLGQGERSNGVALVAWCGWRCWLMRCKRKDRRRMWQID